jgi:hypothetical protein
MITLADLDRWCADRGIRATITRRRGGMWVVTLGDGHRAGDPGNTASRPSMADAIEAACREWDARAKRPQPDGDGAAPLDADGMTVRERAIWTSVLAAAYVSHIENGCQRDAAFGFALETADDAVEDYRRRP